ncbi:MAG: hypothetical protein ACR2IT_06635 [Pirellulales bacterium]
MREALRSVVPSWRTLAVCLVAVVVLGGGDAIACPNCKDAVNTSDPEGLNIARGYFYSILIMLAMPFTLAGSFGVYVWREMRRQRAQEAAAAASASAAESRPEPL